MALASTAYLLRPLKSLDHQSSISSACTTSLGGASSFHGSFSLSLQHRRPQSLKSFVARVAPVEENLDEGEKPINHSAKVPAPWELNNASVEFPDVGNSPPWLKDSSDAVLADGSRQKVHTFRPAPWQRGSRSSTHRTSDTGSPRNDEEYPQEIDVESGKSAMTRIVEKLRDIQRGYEPSGTSEGVTPDGRGASGKIGTVGSLKYTEHPRGRQRGKAARSDGQDASTKKFPKLEEDFPVSDKEPEVLASKFPWEKDEKDDLEEKLAKIQNKRARVPSIAELTLPHEELKKLRIQGLQLEEKLRIGKLGVTRNIVISIHEHFRSSELVKVRCEGPAAASIKKTHLDLEEKTGGLVVLRTGKIIVLYRGSGYEAEQRALTEKSEKDSVSQQRQVIAEAEKTSSDTETEVNNELLSTQGEGKSHADLDAGRVNASLIPNSAANMYHKRQAEAQAEAESLLEGLGPRFENWAGLLPVPIDADLLPSVIPNYRPPFRLMPHGTSPRMSNTEITNLRRLARPIAPHFVLGRNRGHQGLAAAMVKIWEKSEVVKIAVKRRVQNTNNLIMSEELKQLTGGILLSRDKFFITFYRGKDFVPEGVASALAEREASVRTLQELEEKARNERSIPVEWTPYTQPSVAVIGKEKQTPKPSWMDTMDVEEQKRLKVEVVKLQRLALASQLEKKLSITYKKKRKAEAELKKVDAFSNPIDRPVDVETITEEERFMFRKLGLKMKAYLLIGRRGVFDGVVENMHLHWKHRELVKVVVKEVDMMEVQDIARTLEYESGGILVAIVATRKGQAIIMYRGKNYQRPLELRPRNLLTKRKALKRSLELQRHESLSRNIKTLEDQINNIQAELKKLNGFDGAPKSSSNEDSDDPQDLSVTSIKDLNAVSSEKAVNIPGEGKYEELTVVKDTESVPYEEESNPDDLSEKIEQLEMLVRSGPIYRAKPLSNLERLQLRKEALSSGKAPPFFVGQNNGLEGLARGIRIYFLHNHLAKVVVKGRSKDMSMEALIHELEELTGGVFVANEGAKIIMYRGWPAGHKIPHVESLKNITPELLRALEIEEFWEGYMEKSSMFEAETGETDSDFEEANEWTSAVLPGGNDENESEQMAIWEDINEGSDEDSSWEEDDDHDSESRNYNPGQLDMHHDSEEIYGTDNEDEVGINTDEDDRWDVVGDQYEDDSEEGEDDDLKSDEEYSWDVEHEWNHEEDKTTSADQSLTKEPAQSW